ncbi:hypothetical protein N7495_008357 [Penicillium taxi]|uniref:uncharacterized protein n=1 Tax=Penicillium taxi TaxID=168475 RepID=UPI002545B3D4|nr:uncharacterized protein N7495_008357 [Penicillium taxi]KAJ5888316.1 hypothetical protein N7495_008357 [Penicillium taxi]
MGDSKMGDSNVCEKCGTRRRDQGEQFRAFVVKNVLGFIVMTICFVLLKMFFPGALAQPLSN